MQTRDRIKKKRRRAVCFLIEAIRAFQVFRWKTTAAHVRGYARENTGDLKPMFCRDLRSVLDNVHT